ncbi:tRNA nucleotidyltransferase [Desulfonauticus submarinus]
MKIYLVGGSVRDYFLGKVPKDLDFVVLDCKEEEFLKKFPQAKKVGKVKSVFYIGRDEYTLSSYENIEQDLEHRDLTINSLAKQEDGKLIAHPLALDDLEKKILRPIKKQNFLDDPLRVFRAARFWAELPDFTLSEELVETCRYVVQQKDIWEKISPERIGQELCKALKAKRPGNFLAFLENVRGFEFWFEELKQVSQIPAGPRPYHKSSVLGHTIRLMNELAGDFWAVWMAFCHDLGKILTPPDLYPHHYGHEQKGIKVVLALTKRLKLSHKMALAGKLASLYHMQAGNYNDLRSGTKVRLLKNIEYFLEPFFRLVFVDSKKDYLAQAKKDLEIIKQVKLPTKFQGLGPKSGEILLSLQGSALKNINKNCAKTS